MINRYRNNVGPMNFGPISDNFIAFSNWNRQGQDSILSQYEGKGNFDQMSHVFTQGKFIGDQYPSGRGLYGFTSNPVSITKIMERPTVLQHQVKTDVSVGGMPPFDFTEQWHVFDATGPVPGPVLHDGLCPLSHDEIHEMRAALATRFRAETNNAAASSVVSFMEAGKTLSLITGAAGRWTKLMDAAISNDLRNFQKVLARKRSPTKYLESVRAKGARLLELATVSSLSEKEKSSLKRKIRSLEGKIGLYLNGHLEYKYGWKTLLYDIEDHFEALGNAIQPEKDKNIVVRSKRNQKAFGVTKVTIPSQLSANFLVYSDYDVEWSVKVSAGAVVSNAVPYELRYLHQFGMGNLLSSVYELVPFSFITDWFANHLDLLKAAENQRYTTFYDGWTSVRREYRSKCIRSDATILEAQVSELMFYEREARLESEFVVFSNPMNLSRWTDISGIVFNLFSNKIRAITKIIR